MTLVIGICDRLAPWMDHQEVSNGRVKNSAASDPLTQVSRIWTRWDAQQDAIEEHLETFRGY